VKWPRRTIEKINNLGYEPTQPKAAMKYLSMADALAVPLCRYELGNRWK
jgi:hypothetical protein